MLPYLAIEARNAPIVFLSPFYPGYIAEVEEDDAEEDFGLQAAYDHQLQDEAGEPLQLEADIIEEAEEADAAEAEDAEPIKDDEASDSPKPTGRGNT